MVRSYVVSHRLPVLGLSVLGISAFLVRYLVLLRHPAPPGADYGNYLTNLHAMLGADVTGQEVQYPGIFMAYLWLVVGLFGELPGLLVSGPFLGAMLCIPTYSFLRNYARPPFALVGAALLTFSEGVSEMIGWGGNPNLLGMVFGTAFLAFFLRYVKHRLRRDLLAAGVSFGLLAGSHQVSLAFFGVSTLLTLAVLFLQTRRMEPLLRGSLALAAGIAFSVPFIPFYVTFRGASADFLPASPVTLTVGDLVFLVGWLFRESLALWIPIFVIALLGYRRMRREDGPGFALGVSLLVSPFLLAATLMVLHPVRPFYFLYLGILPGAVAFMQAAAPKGPLREDLRKSRIEPTTVAAAITLATALVLVSTANQRMSAAADWYYVLGDDVLDGLAWIRGNTPQDSLIATTGPSQYGAEELVGCMWGWWIEGLAIRKSLCTGDPNAMAWAEQVAHTRDANRAFAGVTTLENGWLRVGDFAPYGSRGNPLISGDFGLGYESVVYFNDARVAVTWHPNGSSTTLTASPFLLPTRNATADASPSFGRIGYVASSSGLQIQRTVEISRASSIVWVNYSMQADGILEGIVLSVFGTSTSRLNNFDYRTEVLSIGGLPGFREHIGGSVAITSGRESLDEADFLTNPESEMPEVRFSFTPRTARFNLSFAVSVEYNKASPPTEVQLFGAMSILTSYHVDYVFLDKARAREMEWLTNDRVQFQIAYQNYGVALFEVIHA